MLLPLEARLAAAWTTNPHETAAADAAAIECAERVRARRMRRQTAPRVVAAPKPTVDPLTPAAQAALRKKEEQTLREVSRAVGAPPPSTPLSRLAPA